MAYFTKAEARAAAARARKKVNNTGKAFDRILKEDFIATASQESFDVFLCHSIDDAELVLGVKTILEENFSLKVYVDWVEDPKLDRRFVSKDTARVLRQRMKQCRSLLYLATDNATTSKWMPWELGFFDGHKPGCVAIFPVLDSADQSFQGQEYIGIYPQVTKDTYMGGVKVDIFVEEKGVQWSTLREFSQGNPQYKKYS
ncbi:MAG: toll-Interleukin receptor [Gammaproteobacteria bacterium]|nr:toll-Interleukin receptor [Gammaproteobacteria bacterium]